MSMHCLPLLMPLVIVVALLVFAHATCIKLNNRLPCYATFIGLVALLHAACHPPLAEIYLARAMHLASISTQQVFNVRYLTTSHARCHALVVLATLCLGFFEYQGATPLCLKVSCLRIGNATGQVTSILAQSFIFFLIPAKKKIKWGWDKYRKF